MDRQIRKAMKIRRGTNISHWLSQSTARGIERKRYFTRNDMTRISDWGFDHVRIPVDEVQLWDETGKPDGEAFDLLDSAVDWAFEQNMKVVVDLHILRSHFFNQSSEPLLFSDTARAAEFANFWQQLSERLCRRPTDMLAYELMNEPVATNSDDWNRVAMLAHGTIRKREPDRTIVLGSN